MPAGRLRGTTSSISADTRLLLPKSRRCCATGWGRDVSLVELLTHTDRSRPRPAPGSLARAAPAAVAAPETRVPGDGAVAIVGLAGRFPGAANVEQLWANLCAGVASIARFSDEGARRGRRRSRTAARPPVRPAAGTLDGVELSTPTSSLQPARGRDPWTPAPPVPRVRLGGPGGRRLRFPAGCCRGPVGVFAGLGFNTYLHQLLTGLDRETVGDLQLVLGNDRISCRPGSPTSWLEGTQPGGPDRLLQLPGGRPPGLPESSSSGTATWRSPAVFPSPCRSAPAISTTPAASSRPTALPAPSTPRRAARLRGSGVGIVVLKRLADAAGARGYPARRHPRLGDQQRRLSASRLHGAERRGAGRGDHRGPGRRGGRSGHRHYVEGARHRSPPSWAIRSKCRPWPGLSRAAGGGKNSCALGSVKSNLGHLDARRGVTA